MPSKDNFYISTAIAYTNAGPHLGHALEFVQADAIARYKRLMGHDTWFLTGTDEHGIKNYNTAKKANKDTLSFVHDNADLFKALKNILDISYDDFIQTTDQKRHWPAAQKMWTKLEENGDIYLKEYEGLYCEGCEMFLKEVDLIDGNCSIHKRPPTPSKESNYFFKLSKYSDQIVRLIESNKLKLVPAIRKVEFLNMAKEGLHDVSFSRPKESLPWGIPVPSNPDHVMYVWCDALTNYISAIGYAEESETFKNRWPADVHLIGKDIVRFHAGIWIGMLIAADLALPKSILIHGFVTHNGEKMSKTLGNVVDPVAVASQYGKDSLRYYLLREIPTGKDGDFNDDLFIERCNTELANKLGNLLNRVHKLVERNEIEEFDFSKENAKAHTENTWAKCIAAMEGKGESGEGYDLHSYIQSILKLVDFANEEMEKTKPWALIKEDREAGIAVLCGLLEVLRHISLLINPIIPETSAKMRTQLGLKASINEESKEWGGVKDWKKLGESEIIFPRIEIA